MFRGSIDFGLAKASPLTLVGTNVRGVSGAEPLSQPCSQEPASSRRRIGGLTVVYKTRKARFCITNNRLAVALLPYSFAPAYRNGHCWHTTFDVCTSIKRDR